MRLLSAILFLAAALHAQTPTDATGWEQLGMSQHAAGKYREAAESFQKALDLGYAPIGKYNLACALARLGEKDRALSILSTMIGNGAQLPIATDHDLDSLRDDPRFRELAAKAAEALEPCRHAQRFPAYRQLDFWIGDWDVFNTAGQKVGDSRIELILKECVILENWTGLQGGSGKSFNAYDPNLHKWQQFWAADSGRTTYYTGELVDGEMRYNTSNTHLTFSKLPGGKVRQHSEITRDNGKTWSTQYDFTYVPKR